MNKNNIKILFITNIPSPYRVMFFNELGKECDLTVIYQKHKSSERNDKWVEKSTDSYKSVFLKGIPTGVDNAFCPSVTKYINDSYNYIVICGNSSPTEILAIHYCIKQGISYCLEGDGAFLKAGDYFKEKIKKYLISNASLYFSTCEELDRYYLHYGADKDKIVRYHFSSLKDSDILKKPINNLEKLKIKEKLGIKENKIVIFVGQFIYRKGLDVLLKAALNLPEEIGFYIIGSTSNDEYISYVNNNNLNNVHFVGFKNKNKLMEYYKAADVLVLPTREDIWGLVVEEAMANGLPVVTTNMCNAGLKLIKDGINGYITNIDDSENIAKCILLSLNDEQLSLNALNAISNYTIEKMVDDHIKTFISQKGNIR